MHKGSSEVTWWRVNDQGTLGLRRKTAKGSEEVGRGRPIVWGLRWHAVTLKWVLMGSRPIGILDSWRKRSSSYKGSLCLSSSLMSSRCLASASIPKGPLIF